MKINSRLAPAIALAAALCCFIDHSSALAASNDGTVEWAGVSHLPIQDRTPLVPLAGESFTLRLQTWRSDVTSVRVVHDAGASPAFASVVGQRGPYDVWEATIPATAANARVLYHFELQDGADVDHYGLDGMSDLAPLGDAWFVIDFDTLEHAPRGATPHPTAGVVFRVWAPSAPAAYVRGDFNSWGLTHPMTALGDDYVAVVPTASINQYYKFFFDYPGTTSDLWATDLFARSVDGGNNYNAIVHDPTLYPWGDGSFEMPDLEEMVIYQLHVGTFSGLNDPRGATPFPGRYIDVANRADHLAELGVNAVMLNPVGEFPGDRSAGYNPVSQFAPERIYGGPNDFRRLVDAMHERGIAVLLDIVWNHQSISDNVYWNYDGQQIWFDDPPQDTPWGAQLDFDRPEIRDHLLQSAHAWFEEYHVDGFRMDATDFMNIGSQEAAGWGIMQRLNDEVDNRWADHVVIAEQLPDDAYVTRPTSLGGAGFDAQYFDAFTDRLREEILDAAFGDPSMSVLRDVINGYGAYLSGNKVVNYVELHDEAWPSSGGQRLVKTIDPTVPHDDEYARGRTMLAQGLVMTSPGIPAMLMGSEWLEDADFGTDEGNRIDWSKKTTYAGVFAYYQDMIALRTTRPALRADAYWNVSHLNESGNVLALRRGLGDDTMLIVANFSETTYNGYRLGVPVQSDWRVVIDSQDAAYGGSGALNTGVIGGEAVSYDGLAQSIQVEIPARSLLVIERDPDVVAVGPGAVGETQLRLLPAAPNPSAGHTLVRLRLVKHELVRLTLHDVRGRRVRVLQNGVLEAGMHEISLDTRALGRGTYFVRLRTETTTSSTKLVVVD